MSTVTTVAVQPPLSRPPGVWTTCRHSGVEDACSFRRGSDDAKIQPPAPPPLAPAVCRNTDGFMKSLAPPPLALAVCHPKPASDFTEFSMLAKLAAFPGFLVVENTFIELVDDEPAASIKELQGFLKLRRSHSCPGSLWHDATAAVVECCANFVQNRTAVDVATTGTQTDTDGQKTDGKRPAESSPTNSHPDWSVGTMWHGTGRCRPCVFLHKDKGCVNGLDCTFCHACDAQEKRRRQKARVDRKETKRAESDAYTGCN